MISRTFGARQLKIELNGKQFGQESVRIEQTRQFLVDTQTIKRNNLVIRCESEIRQELDRNAIIRRNEKFSKERK